jgi:RNA polymerase sigma-70 factor, ECF subfamily
VLGWIMNQARSRALDRLRFESRKKRRHGGDEHPLAEDFKTAASMPL